MKRRRNSVSSSESENDEEKRTLFVANLHAKTTDEIFFELFLQAGPIESVKIPKDKDTNKQKNFGFVTYKHVCAVPYAIQLYDGVKLFGQRLTIRARETRERNQSLNSSRETYEQQNYMNYTARNDKVPEINFENMKQFAPQLVEGIRGSFENPFQPTSSGKQERQKNNYKSRNDSHYNHRDKPYQKHNNVDRRNHYSHRNDRRSDQRRNR